MVNRFEQFSSTISGIYRSIQKLEREEMEKHGLKGAFAQYLVALSHRPEGVTAAQLCEACDMDKSAVSRTIGEMEERGLVTRAGSNDNLYRAVLCLTEEGKRIADFVFERATVAVLKAGEGLTNSHRKLFYASLELIASNLQRICDDGIPENP